MNADTLDKLGSQPDTELEADRTAGTILHKMGATLAQTRQALELFANEQASATHPAKAERIAAMNNGWIESENTIGKIESRDLVLFTPAEIKTPIASYPKTESLDNKTMEDSFNEAVRYYDKKEYAKALPLFQKLAELGHAKGQNKLGNMYYYGEGVDKDYKQAVYWYRKSAEQGNTNGQYNLGFMYENGYGVERDNTKAKEWYRKAAAQGNETAKANLKALGEN